MNLDSEYSSDDFRRCIELLEAINADRMLLSQLSAEDRRQLMMAAGRMSRPDRLEVMKIGRAHRRVKEKKKKAQDRTARAATHIRGARREEIYAAPLPLLPSEIAQLPAQILENPRYCYVCKVEFRELHFFYDAMCKRCGDFNYAKRFQSAPLDGKVALITGARVKIGYQAALMMLRAGARVVVTTRFPRDAAVRFSKEQDFETWKDRLQVHGLDLRHAPSVELFTRYMNDTFDRLDILINNAAQTVRRPRGWYKHLMDRELAPYESLPAGAKSLLQNHERGALPKLLAGDSRWIAQWHESKSDAAIGISSSAKLSQIPWANDDMTTPDDVFPEGKLDADLQQVDLRAKNTWRMTLGEVPTPEMIEVQLVNSVAPFILCSKLKPLMLKAPNRDKHVINVSAMEGKFTRWTKTDKHPHTNMAKAALNMMTLTSAPDYVKDGIHMNAVDTGWVTDEDPLLISKAKQEEHDFQPPLDIVDGAARVCDPFFNGILTGEHVWGKFLKDYAPTDW